MRRYSDYDIQRLFDVFAINPPATDSYSECALAIYSGRIARLIEISSQPGFDFDKVDEIGGCLSDLAHLLGLPDYAVAIEEMNRMRTLERPLHEAIVAPWSPDYVEYSWKQERYAAALEAMKRIREHARETHMPVTLDSDRSIRLRVMHAA